MRDTDNEVAEIKGNLETMLAIVRCNSDLSRRLSSLWGIVALLAIIAGISLGSLLYHVIGDTGRFNAIRAELDFLREEQLRYHSRNEDSAIQQNESAKVK